MYNSIFSSSFYWIFDIPNFTELKDYVDSRKDINNARESWSEHCKVDTIYLNSPDTQYLIKPSLDLFVLEAFSTNVKLNMSYPWINLYKKGYFQEIHDHKVDIACVFFINDGPHFSDFYFYNRNNNCVSNKFLSVLRDENLRLGDKYIPEYKEGQVIFFPGTMLHGVTPHKSDTIRKTVSCNFEIV